MYSFFPFVFSLAIASSICFAEQKANLDAFFQGATVIERSKNSPDGAALFSKKIHSEVKQASLLIEALLTDSSNNVLGIKFKNGQRISFDRFDTTGMPLDYKREFPDGTVLIYKNGILNEELSSINGKAYDKRQLEHLAAKETVNMFLDTNKTAILDAVDSSFIEEIFTDSIITIPIRETDKSILKQKNKSIAVMDILSLEKLTMRILKDLPVYRVVEGIRFTDQTYELYDLCHKPEHMHPWLTWCLYGYQVTQDALDAYEKLEEKCKRIYAGAEKGIGVIRINDVITAIPIRMWPDQQAGKYELVEKIVMPKGEWIDLSFNSPFYEGTSSCGKIKLTKADLIYHIDHENIKVAIIG